MPLARSVGEKSELALSVPVSGRGSTPETGRSQMRGTPPDTPAMNASWDPSGEKARCVRSELL
jgi:hypothetical protein